MDKRLHAIFLKAVTNSMNINAELFEFLRILNRGVLDNQKIQNIVDRTFAETGEYRTGIGFEDFKALLLSANHNLENLFSCRQ